jgi:hypothetical protein
MQSDFLILGHLVLNYLLSTRCDWPSSLCIELCFFPKSVYCIYFDRREKCHRSSVKCGNHKFVGTKSVLFFLNIYHSSTDVRFYPDC